MKVAEKAVRQSVSLPPRVAKQVGSMAKSRKLSKNRMLLALIENGIDAEKRKQQQFFALAERFRNEQEHLLDQQTVGQGGFLVDRGYGNRARTGRRAAGNG